MRWRAVLSVLPFLAACAGGGDPGGDAEGDAVGRQSAGGPSPVASLVELWGDDLPVFGVFVQDERGSSERGSDRERLPPIHTAEGGAALGANPLLDYVFLNLEPAYNGAAVSAIAEGLDRAGPRRVALLVRIPTVEAEGPDAARRHVIDAFGRGADGVVVPHVRSPEEAALVMTFFADAGVNLWSPANPSGTSLAQLMIEDGGALAQASAIADTPGYSILACGIGSLGRALEDRGAAEVGNQEILAHSKRVGVPDMLTANASDVARRIEEGFLALLMSGPDADEAIRIGRKAAGRTD